MTPPLCGVLLDRLGQPSRAACQLPESPRPNRLHMLQRGESSPVLPTVEVVGDGEGEIFVERSSTMPDPIAAATCNDEQNLHLSTHGVTSRAPVPQTILVAGVDANGCGRRSDRRAPGPGWSGRIAPQIRLLYKSSCAMQARKLATRYWVGEGRQSVPEIVPCHAGSLFFFWPASGKVPWLTDGDFSCGRMSVGVE